MTPGIEVRRLGVGDTALARGTFTLMAEVFEEPHGSLNDSYLAGLLARDNFWVLAALDNGVPVGGITGHTLPMTRDESTELFIYDLAVHQDRQRQGVGRALVRTLCAQAAAQGITVAFVPADNGDVHALDFYRALGGAETPVTIFTFE